MPIKKSYVDKSGRIWSVEKTNDGLKLVAPRLQAIEFDAETAVVLADEIAEAARGKK